MRPSENSFQTAFFFVLIGVEMSTKCKAIHYLV